MIRILVCEDDAHIRRLMVDSLKKANYEVLQAEDGEIALDILDSNHIDLLITDIMMPNLDGFTLTSDLRKSQYEFPILMITAKDSIDDKKIGFRSGADDYIVKPFDMDEMLIRVEVLLRRAKIYAEKKIELSEMILNQDQYSVIYKNESIDLPKKEFELLFKLVSNPNKIFTRMQLMEEIWGLEAESDERTIDVHIKRLREKFENCKDFEIVTLRGLGYKVVKHENDK